MLGPSPPGAVLVGQRGETGSPGDAEQVRSVLQTSLPQTTAVFGPPRPAQSCPHGQGLCRGSPASAFGRARQRTSVHAVSGASRSPSPSPAQGWQGTREIKQAISKAERKAAIWALTDRSFNEQREFSREAGEMQRSE